MRCILLVLLTAGQFASNKAEPKKCQTDNAQVAGLPDAMMYDCNEDGSFNRKQCYGFLDQCWCVDPISGKEIEDTRMSGAQFNLDCEKGETRVYADGTCGSKRQQTMKSLPAMIVGMYIENCDLDGNYETTQCHPSTGECWCVDKTTGSIIYGTATVPGEPLIDCNNLLHISSKKCQSENAQVTGIPDALLYDCNDDGTFKQKQCYGFLDHCWCVDPITGEEIEDTRMRGADFNLDCEKGETREYADGTCGSKRQQTTEDVPEMIVGMYIEYCDIDGNYETTQCHPSTGECWCVDKITGTVIDGTTMRPGEPLIDCDSTPIPSAPLTGSAAAS